MHVEKFFARNLGGLTRARTRAGPVREGKSRTPNMYAGEKSDEAIVPRKRPNKGRQLPAEVVEGRASPEGNQPTGFRGPDIGSIAPNHRYPRLRFTFDRSRISGAATTIPGAGLSTGALNSAGVLS